MALRSTIEKPQLVTFFSLVFLPAALTSSNQMTLTPRVCESEMKISVLVLFLLAKVWILTPEVKFFDDGFNFFPDSFSPPGFNV